MDPDRIHTILDQASDLLHAGKPAETLRCLEGLDSAALDDEERIEFASLRAWALSETGQADQALALLEDLLEGDPRCARLHGIRGVVLSNIDALSEARDALELAVSLDGRDEVAMANLALVYERLREYPLAIEYYDRAIDLGAEMDWSLQRKAAAQTEAGDAAGAIATLRRYLSLAPDDARQWIALGVLYSDEAQHEEAFSCYRIAERIDPRSPVLRLNWGISAVRAGRMKRARQQQRLLSRVAPHSARPGLLQAFIAEQEGKLEEARLCYSEALERIAPADAEELQYALQMALEFFSRQGARGRCMQLFRRAYAANACGIEICEAYRRISGERVDDATRYSVRIEADLREGLVLAPRRVSSGRPRRYGRVVHVVARDRDEAAAAVMGLLRTMRERRPRLRAFLRSEPIGAARVGVYEVEPVAHVIPRSSD